MNGTQYNLWNVRKTVILGFIDGEEKVIYNNHPL